MKHKVEVLYNRWYELCTIMCVCFPWISRRLPIKEHASNRYSLACIRYMEKKKMFCSTPTSHALLDPISTFSYGEEMHISLSFWGQHFRRICPTMILMQIVETGNSWMGISLLTYFPRETYHHIL